MLEDYELPIEPAPDPTRRPYEVDPPPWPWPVDMDPLLSELSGVFRRYVILPPHADVVLSLWTIATYCHQFGLTEYAPRIIVKSPEPMSGKSRLLRLLAYLVSRPYEVVDPTAASIYYTVDEHHPTILFDENEHSSLPSSGPLTGILNSGHAPNGYVPRRIGGVTREFSTFSFAALAGIGDLPRTLETRAYIIWMMRRLAHEHVERLNMRKAPPEFFNLRRRMFRWVADNQESIDSADPDTGELTDRDADSARTLLVIADIAGGDWARRAREAIVALVGDNKEISESALLLSDIAAIFNDPTNPVHDFMSSDDLVTALNRIEDHDWSLSKKMLANLLKPYRVRPKVVRTSTGTPRGYRRIWFRDAWARYLNLGATTTTSETPPVSDVSDVAGPTAGAASPLEPALPAGDAASSPVSSATNATSETETTATSETPKRGDIQVSREVDGWYVVELGWSAGHFVPIPLGRYDTEAEAIEIAKQYRESGRSALPREATQPATPNPRAPRGKPVDDVQMNRRVARYMDLNPGMSEPDARAAMMLAFGPKRRQRPAKGNAVDPSAGG